MSQAEQMELLVKEFHDANVRLNAIWDLVHMDERSRLTRTSFANENVKKYINNIVNSEKEMVDGVLFDIGKRRETAAELRKLFDMPPFVEHTYQPNSIALLKALDKDVNALRVRKQALIDKQVDVYERYAAVCRRMATPFQPIDGILDEIVDEKVLGELETATAELESVLFERLDEVHSMQLEDQKILDQLPHGVELTAVESRLLYARFDEPDAAIDEAMLAEFRALDQKLKDQYDDWIEQVAFKYDELIVKVGELSKKCSTDLVSKYPAYFDPARQTTDCVKALEADVMALEEKYERGRPVFDKLNEWMTLWSEKLNVERRVCRTSFYRNRGGTLNTTLKRQKQIQVQVPKVFAELERMVSDYRAKYNPEDIRIDGMLPDEYARSVEASYHHDKEIQKAQKQMSTKGKENAAAGNKTASNKTRTLLGRSVFRPPLTAASPGPSSVMSSTRMAGAGGGGCTLTTTTSSRKRSFSVSDLSHISPTKPALSSLQPFSSSPNKMSNNNNNAPHRLQHHISTIPEELAPRTPGPVAAITPSKTPSANTAGCTLRARAVTPSRPWY